MSSLAAPLAFPLGGGFYVATDCDVWAQDLIEVSFEEPMKNDDLLQAPEAYLIMPVTDGQSVTVTGVQTGSEIAPRKIYLIVTRFTNGKLYRISFQNLYGLTGAVLTPTDCKFIGRTTKQDSMIRSRPQMLDMTPDATLRKVLQAIGRQDDLLGGSRNDRLFAEGVLQLIQVTVLPATASLAALATQQFTASVGGTLNQNVVWDVDGTIGGNPIAGTVSVTGFYTAPAAGLPGDTHLVRATSVADPTKSDGALVTIV